MNDNSDAFEQLLHDTYEVQCSTAGISLLCRRVPFTTVTHVLAEVATSAQAEVAEARRAIVAELKALSPDMARGEAGWKSILSSPEGATRLLGILLPVLTGIVGTVPYLLERFLLDVIVGATTDVVKHLSVEDGAVVIEAAFTRMDRALIGGQVDRVFFGLSQMINSLGKKTSESDAPKPNDDESPTDEEPLSDDTPE